MAEGASPNTANLRNLSLCYECGSNPWKYRCPGCSIRSCSLACVNSHKKRTGCMGKRSHTEVVPLSQFDDNLLLSDYKLLEETKRVADSARRKSSDFHGYFHLRLPYKLWILRKAANRRKTCLLFFPPGMSKREKNNSRYNPRRKHLAPGPWNHKLRPFCDVQLEDLKLFVRKNPKGSKSLFRKLDIKAPIHRQFSNITILEYPVIFVYLPSFDHDFEVETWKIPSIRDTVPPSICPSPSGTLYKVEEVEEGDGASDTIITDLMFYFDQEVRDAYSDLIGEMNPDDFLCLDDSFEISKGNVLGESKGNEGFKELEEAEGNVLKKMRIGNAGEIGDHFFFSDEVPFGEMELEEGEIPCCL
ncbi:hypothetical protein KSP40_PGU019046 [Platanthera guangdongensis]|uniref:HIT-type domain-containing protein n=1 Tax=Platanthera guangdongensis TaxID=2320717 RepID=A0ABR2LXX8_9ASPA